VLMCSRPQDNRLAHRARNQAKASVSGFLGLWGSVQGMLFEAISTLRTTVGSWLDKDPGGLLFLGSPLGLGVDE